MSDFSRGFQIFALPLVSIYCHIRFRLKISGRENLPEGGCMVCANHSHVADGVLAPVALTNRVMLRAMAKKELFSVPLFRNLITWLGAFPVDRSGADMAAVKLSLATVKNGGRMILFPQGTRGTRATPAKEGAVRIAMRAGVPIVPMYISENQGFRKTVHVAIGKPYQVDKANKDYTTAAADLMARIYALDPSTTKD